MQHFQKCWGESNPSNVPALDPLGILVNSTSTRYFDAVPRTTAVEDVWEEGTMYKESNIGV